ncbi:zinc finger protein ZAT1 [Brachypodium distachyon]|nr:zinc finger protein ZAT1 [Brachypodium distachyon]|eukprot:XP_003572064.1 zinc finger protein ZAT1 [Brachypodium distachyon]
MDRHTCKLCFRRFQNGRALGGHMRSHVMAAAAAATAAAAYSPPVPQQSPPLSLASTSSTAMDGAQAQRKTLPCVFREDPKESRKVKAGGALPEFSGGYFGGPAAGGESSVVQDGESDAESTPRGGGGGGAGFAVSRRRSKRARRRRAADPEQQPASSVVSDATREEEDVAMSLVMLSRDSWARPRSEPEPRSWARASSEAAKQNNVFDDDHDHDVAGDEEYYYYGEPATAARGPRGSNRHQCGVCKKVFRSYQALGGHRASVKKGKGGCVPPPAPGKKGSRAGDGVVHECPFCFRVFGSGQALGGHKRSHMRPAAAAAATSPAAKCGDSSFGSFDLNVAPPAFDDDFELSAVYDAEFGSSTRR